MSKKQLDLIRKQLELLIQIAIRDDESIIFSEP